MSVPVRLIAPEVGVDGKSPVEPPEKLVTPPAKENCRQDPAAYPSKVDVVVLNLSCPSDPTGCWASVPLGKVADPEPGRMGLSASPMFGFPPAPVPLVTAIWFDDPMMVT